MRTQRKPASEIILSSPGCGSVKWIFTPRLSSTVGALGETSQQPRQLIEVRSAEVAREMQSESETSARRNFIKSGPREPGARIQFQPSGPPHSPLPETNPEKTNARVHPHPRGCPAGPRASRAEAIPRTDRAHKKDLHRAP